MLLEFVDFDWLKLEMEVENGKCGGIFDDRDI